LSASATVGSRVTVLISDDDALSFKATVLETSEDTDDDSNPLVLLDPLDDFDVEAGTIFGPEFQSIVDSGIGEMFANDGELRPAVIWRCNDASSVKRRRGKREKVAECKGDGPPPLPQSNFDCEFNDNTSSGNYYKSLGDLHFSSPSHPTSPDLLSALSFYARAVHTLTGVDFGVDSRNKMIGATCLINRGGFVLAAEVDAIEDGHADVMLVNSPDASDGDTKESELQIKSSAILLPLPPRRGKIFQSYDSSLSTLQSILFNSSRSLARLSKKKYVSIKTGQSFGLSAIHVISLGLGVVEWRRREGREEQRDNNISYEDSGYESLESREEELCVAEAKGRHIRGDLFLAKGDFQRAKTEANKGLKIIGDSDGGMVERCRNDLNKLKEKIQKKKARASLVDKSLAKGVARLVNRSMKEGRDGEGVKQMERMMY